MGSHGQPEDVPDMGTDTTTSTTDTSKPDDKSGGDGGGTDTGSTTTTDDGDDGDVSKWKALARKHENAAGKLQAEIDKIKASTQSEQEKAIETAKAEARAEARAELLADMVDTTLEAVAADKLADTSYVRLLDADTREGFITKDGKVDRKAMGDAIDALVKKHPNLAKSASNVRPLKGGGGDASRSSGVSMNDEIRRRAGRG